MKVCKSDDLYAGYFLTSSDCYTLQEGFQNTLSEHIGSVFYKKVMEKDFSLEAFLQNPTQFTCLMETNNADSSCFHPYDYKGSSMYACRNGCLPPTLRY